MKFTKEEISLCKQVAKKYKKEIEYGDWYLNQHDKKVFPHLYRLNLLTFVKEVGNKHIIPLWTISDCLEFLREKKKVIELWIAGRGSNWICRIKGQKWWKGKTPLEALLKAILAVLGDEDE